jgi:uncharacterized protein (TIGR00661 family)
LAIKLKKKILFLINGEGLGNSTRCYAIIERLLNFDVELYSVLSKNSSWFFSKIDCFTKRYDVDQISYSFDEEGKLNTFKSLINIFNSIKIYNKNINFLKKIIDEIKPDKIITDSVYVFSFIKKFQIPIISINNSCLTIRDSKNIKNLPKSIKSHLYFIEYLDYCYHTIFPDLTLSCGLTKKEEEKFKNCLQISPITRSNLKILNKKSGKCLVMLSGGLELNKKIDLSFIEEEVIFVNANSNIILNKKSSQILPKIANNIDILNQVDFSIINSGYSAITESICFNKPVISVPIENHAEQWLNAKKLNDERFGLISTFDNLKKDYLKFKSNFDQYLNNTSKLKNTSNGSDEAANIILKF